ncbi:MAG: four helix bundle protein [Balneolaceae bacterium]|nr:four helix bundle protein [Balneolaceae bacterium]
MKYQDWLKTIPKDITDDSVWNLKVYRAALYLSDLNWEDTQKIIERKFFSLSDQLYSSTDSISANVTEEYSRNSHKEKARFYEIALGSARKSKNWYFKSRHICTA